MKNRFVIAALVLGLSAGLGGCSTAAKYTTFIAQHLSTSTPEQVRTLAEALQAATLVTNAVDLYVNTANPSRATLIELQTLNENVHSTLGNLQAANANDQSLAIAAFNEALTAFIAYATTKGVPK